MEEERREHVAKMKKMEMEMEQVFEMNDGLVGSPFSPRDSRVFSNTTVQKHQFFGAQLYGPTLTSVHDYWKNHSFD